jgi:hypothetical protein
MEFFEWLRSTRKDRERKRGGGIKVHTMESGRRWVKAKDVLRTEAAKEHLATVATLASQKSRRRPTEVSS